MWEPWLTPHSDELDIVADCHPELLVCLIGLHNHSGGAFTFMGFQHPVIALLSGQPSSEL